MKAFVVFAAAIAISQAASMEGVSSSLMQAAVRAKWANFKATHGKEYHPSDEPKRMQTFLERTHHIESHNERHAKGLESFRMGHNQFSDMSPQEMQSRMGVRVPANVEEMRANATHHIMSPAAGVAEQAEIDWRWWGGVQPVKNQGSCGSCYAFSAAGALETAEFRRKDNKDLPDVSEQNIVDCTGGKYQNGGCSGGWMWNAFQYIKDVGGVMPQKDYPYEAEVKACRHDLQNVAMRVNSFTLITRGDEQQLLDAVRYSGSVSIAYNAGTNEHTNYKEGVLDVEGCGNQPTHAVLVIGYGTENGKDYWLIKNSWGDWWGDKGYFKMARGKNMCGIADWAAYPTAG